MSLDPELNLFYGQAVGEAVGDLLEKFDLNGQLSIKLKKCSHAAVFQHYNKQIMICVSMRRGFKGLSCLSECSTDETPPTPHPQCTSRPCCPNSLQTGTDRLLVVIDMTPAEAGFKLLKTDVAHQNRSLAFMFVNSIDLHNNLKN